MTRLPRELQVDDEQCRIFQPVLEFVGQRWVGAILLAGIRGARRFTEYRELVPGISDRMLSRRLKELQARDLVERAVEADTPVRIRYAPTDRGRGLVAAMQPLMAWSAADRSSREPAHTSPVPTPADSTTTTDTSR